MCGPDRSPWISQRFDTPQLAAQTLFEAIRRDDPDTVYLCLSQGYRRRHRLDGLTVAVFWARFREQNPGLHVAGYATVPAAARTGRDRAHVTVEVEGRLVDIDLERQAYREVRWSAHDGTPLECGTVLPSLEQVARIEATEEEKHADRSRLVVAPFDLEHENEAPTIDSIEFAGLLHRWKIADLRIRP